MSSAAVCALCRAVAARVDATEASGEEAMNRRQRKFLGVVVTLVFVVVYALVAMALAQARFVQGAPDLLQWIYYAVIGMGWVLPIMPLIRWMERPDTGAASWSDEA